MSASNAHFWLPCRLLIVHLNTQRNTYAALQTTTDPVVTAFVIRSYKVFDNSRWNRSKAHFSPSSCLFLDFYLSAATHFVHLSATKSELMFWGRTFPSKSS